MTDTTAERRVFMDIAIGARRVGRLVFTLFYADAPRTTENFRVLCTAERGPALSYRRSSFHRIIQGFMVQGGDFTNHDGSGGRSIYNNGGAFPDEPFVHKHSEPFLLSSANSGRDSNRSQFFITSRPCPHLDGKHVVFGRLISGFDVFREIENVPTDSRDRPLDPVIIEHCGELVRKSGPSAITASAGVVGSAEDSHPVSSTSDKTHSQRDKDDDDKGFSSKDAKKRKSKKMASRSKKSRHRRSESSSSTSQSDESNSESDSSSSSSSISRSKNSEKTAHAKNIVNIEHKFLDREYDLRNPERIASIQEKEERFIRERSKNVRVDDSGRVVKGRGSV
ncbi:hypothetical protein HDU82_003805, partial [Entophlyctis luteolus]